MRHLGPAEGRTGVVVQDVQEGDRSGSEADVSVRHPTQRVLDPDVARRHELAAEDPRGGTSVQTTSVPLPGQVLGVGGGGYEAGDHERGEALTEHALSSEGWVVDTPSVYPM